MPTSPRLGVVPAGGALGAWGLSDGTAAMLRTVSKRRGTRAPAPRAPQVLGASREARAKHKRRRDGSFVEGLRRSLEALRVDLRRAPDEDEYADDDEPPKPAEHVNLKQARFRDDPRPIDDEGGRGRAVAQGRALAAARGHGVRVVARSPGNVLSCNNCRWRCWASLSIHSPSIRDVGPNTHDGLNWATLAAPPSLTSDFNKTYGDA